MLVVHFDNCFSHCFNVDAIIECCWNNFWVRFDECSLIRQSPIKLVPIIETMIHLYNT